MRLSPLPDGLLMNASLVTDQKAYIAEAEKSERLTLRRACLAMLQKLAGQVANLCSHC